MPKATFWAFRGSVPPLVYMRITEGKVIMVIKASAHNGSVPSTVAVTVLWGVLRLREFSNIQAATGLLDQLAARHPRLPW